MIASTQAAVENNKNSFTTGGSLSTSDLQNSASFKGSAVGISADVGQQAGKSGVSGVGVGVGSDKGNASSTTVSGISGIAGNTAVRSTDAQTGLKKIFDAAKVQKEIDAQVQITQSFGKEATKAVGTFAAEKLKAAQASGDQAEIDKWKEGGPSRVALHILVGGLGGGVGGALGAGASSISVPYIAAAINSTELSEAVRAGLIAAASTALGASVGGGAPGAAAAFSEVINNCLASTCLSIQWDKSAPGYHAYTATPSPVLCNTAEAGCMEAVKKQLSCNSAPGQPVCSMPGNFKEEGMKLSGNNWITQYVSPNGQVVINGTMKDKHALDDGYVMRWISEDSSGAVRILTYGEGVNKSWSGIPASAMGRVNSTVGPALFTSLGIQNQVDVRNYLLNQSQKK